MRSNRHTMIIVYDGIYNVAMNAVATPYLLETDSSRRQIKFGKFLSASSSWSSKQVVSWCLIQEHLALWIEFRFIWMLHFFTDFVWVISSIFEENVMLMPFDEYLTIKKLHPYHGILYTQINNIFKVYLFSTNF